MSENIAPARFLRLKTPVSDRPHRLALTLANMNTSSSLNSRLQSFKYAFTGILTLLRSQANARIHLLATLAALATGLYVKLSTVDWSLIVISIMAVWTAEALNTALEFLADATHPEFHPLIKKSKDVAAASVLISALGAIIIATLIFMPHLLDLLQST